MLFVPKGKSSRKGSSNTKKRTPTPQQLAVIAALLTNALTVRSILIDSDQTVQIVLEGSIRKKTKADRLLSELSEISLGDLLQAVSRNS